MYKEANSCAVYKLLCDIQYTHSGLINFMSADPLITLILNELAVGPGRRILMKTFNHMFTVEWRQIKCHISANLG